VQAAYTVLSALYPSQVGVLDAHLAESLARIPGNQGKSESIRRGRPWGEYVAREILEWRSTDGWLTQPSPYFGSFEAGVWRSIPVPGSLDGTLPAAVPQLAILEPFAMDSPSQSRPGPPYAPTLTEAIATEAYAADVNEVKAIGREPCRLRRQGFPRWATMTASVHAGELSRAWVLPPRHHRHGVRTALTMLPECIVVKASFH
jgi:hypothetical protein